MSKTAANTKLIKNEANRLGFMYCGISQAGYLEEDAPRLEQWLHKNMNGAMGYMERNFDKRLDPTLLVPGAKSVVSLLLNYFPSKTRRHKQAPKISKYALGKDYHYVIKDKLKELYRFINDNIGEVGGRVFVDSAPVLDKVWAKKSGLGWIGKHSNLINKNSGSFFFIAELIIDLELKYDGPVPDYCGSCSKCIDACPTNAIVEPYVVDGSKCISYYTIELKENLPLELKGKLDEWVFGCDVCQDVCPWNRFSTTHSEPDFEPNETLLKMTANDWQEMTLNVFNETFKESPIQRPGYKRMMENVSFSSERI